MDNTLNETEIMLFANEFQKELVRLHENQGTQSYWSRMIMPREKIQTIINHLNGVELFPPGKERTWIENRKLRVFKKPELGLDDVLMEPTKEKLSLGDNNGQVFSRYLQIVPRDDIFDTLLSIHLKNNHSTLRETLHLVRGIISNIPRYLVHKFILLCPVCSNNGATTNSCGLPYTPSRRCAIKARKRRKLMDQFQVDVLDLRSNPDGGYSYILHCMDHITGFHWLFPLADVDAAEVAQNLVWGIFSLFGFPSELVSDYGRAFATQVIDQVCLLWPDELHIKNYLEGGTYKGDVTRRNTRNVTRFIDDMAIKKTAQGDPRVRWSEWLPEIQFMLNATVLDVRTGKTPFEKVFRTQPITHVPKSKFVGCRVETISEHPKEPQQSTENSVEHEIVTEEIVEHIHHDDVNAGVIMEEVYPSGDFTVAAEQISAAPMEQQDESSTVELVEDGLAFATIETEGEAFTVVPPDGGTAFTFLEKQIGSDDNEIFAVSPAKEHIKLDDSHFNNAKAMEDKWVTLSASGDGLEIAQIKPTIQEVKISSGKISGYRLEPVTRKAVYVTDDSVNNKQNSAKKITFERISKGSSTSKLVTPGGNNNFKGFKSPSPMKGSRVIHLSNIGDTMVESRNDTPNRQVNASIKAVTNIGGDGYSTLNVPVLSGGNSLQQTNSVKRLGGFLPSPVKKFTLTTTSGGNSRLPSTIRTNVVAAQQKPVLKIPTSVAKTPSNSLSASNSAARFTPSTGKSKITIVSAAKSAVQPGARSSNSAARFTPSTGKSKITVVSAAKSDVRSGARSGSAGKFIELVSTEDSDTEEEEYEDVIQEEESGDDDDEEEFGVLSEDEDNDGYDHLL